MKYRILLAAALAAFAVAPAAGQNNDVAAANAAETATNADANVVDANATVPVAPEPAVAEPTAPVAPEPGPAPQPRSFPWGLLGLLGLVGLIGSRKGAS